MTRSKFISAGVLALTVSLVAACTANSAETLIQKTTQSTNYLKPGASVTYSHTLKSQLSAGETTTFRLFMDESYKAGTLFVNLSADGDILLFPTSTQASFDMTEGETHNMSISLTANTNGRYYINVEALAVDGAGRSQPRIFSLPVQVGPITPQKPNPDMKTMENGEKIIEMEAQEEIK